MRLPVELLPNITEHLHTTEILKCRLVCKEWRCYIDEFCLDELILFISFYPTLELWKANSEPIDFKRMLFLTSDRCLSDEGFKYTFRNVRKLLLTIRNEQEASYKLDFSKLEHLEIIRHNSEYSNHDDSCSIRFQPYIGGRRKCVAGFELNLNNLKTLHVNTLCDRIVLNNCPNLSELSYHLVYPSFSRPIHYKQIRKLTCFRGHPFIKGLENLESLVCHSYFDEDDRHLLKYLPKLKFLYFFACASLNVRPLEEDKVRLNRNDLELYYFGKMGKWWENGRCDLLNFTALDCDESHSFYYGDDLAKLAPTLPNFSTLTYDPTFRGYDRRFYERLINVQALNIVQGPTTQAEIVELIGYFKSIVILQVNEGEHLDQNFYNLLPDHYPHLRAIYIDNRLLDELDLHFLFRLNHLYAAGFKNLESIHTHPHYTKLTEQLRKKKREITSINGNLLFQIDRLKFKLKKSLLKSNQYWYGFRKGKGTKRPRVEFRAALDENPQEDDSSDFLSESDESDE